MNDLADKFGDKLAILGVPSNQFGHQTNENDKEFVNTLKYVRPGNGFEFKGEIFACSKVNGAKQVSSVYRYYDAVANVCKEHI